MILDISDAEFRHIFNDKDLFLPIRWDGENFVRTLELLFEKYITNVKLEVDYNVAEDVAFLDDIKQVCRSIIWALEKYFNGYPACALHEFFRAMRILQKKELKIYQKTGYIGSDPLNLYRAVKVPDNKPYGRDRVFHTPFNMRAKVSTSRYSIAGFPSLYLGTSLKLCCDEIKAKVNKDLVLAALFKLDRNLAETERIIRVIELGIKPQDFILEENGDYESRNEISRDGKRKKKRIIEQYLLQDNDIRAAYLLWYPLIAACSFIRVNKEDPFAAEYIIPQLLMQWVRMEMSNTIDNRGEIIGIRYFSCASVRASDMGFNYVFPTYGERNGDIFCSVLRKAFWIKGPVYISEYENVESCEAGLQNQPKGKI